MSLVYQKDFELIQLENFSNYLYNIQIQMSFILHRLLLDRWSITESLKTKKESRAERNYKFSKFKFAQKRFKISLKSLRDVRGFQFCRQNIPSTRGSDGKGTVTETGKVAVTEPG